MFTWQLPISQQSRNLSTNRLHLMPQSDRTDELLPALCGHKFNPGFAIHDDTLPKCFNCQRRLKWTTPSH
jgi:hypothetical protein